MIEIKKLNKQYIQKINQGFLKNTFSPKYKKFDALKNIELTIGKGEFCGILGKNGAGKSTFIKLLCGLQKPTSGNINIFGNSVNKYKSELFKKIAVIFGQKSSLWWDLPLSDSIDATKFIYDISEDDFKTRKEYIVSALGLETVLSRPVRVLSLGERVKGELAFNLMHKPELILLDEPTIGLDVVSKAKLRDFLKELVDSENVTVLLTSHDTGDIEYCCDRICIIDEGEIKFDGKIETFRNLVSLESMISLCFISDKINTHALSSLTDIYGVNKVIWCNDEYKINITYQPQMLSSVELIRLINELDLSSSAYSIIETRPSFEDAILANFGVGAT